MSVFQQQKQVSAHIMPRKVCGKWCINLNLLVLLMALLPFNASYLLTITKVALIICSLNSLSALLINKQVAFAMEWDLKFVKRQ